MVERAAAGRRAIRAGADPYLTLAEVVWPSFATDAAMRGEYPAGWRALTDEELQARKHPGRAA